MDILIGFLFLVAVCSLIFGMVILMLSAGSGGHTPPQNRFPFIIRHHYWSDESDESEESGE